MATAAFLLILGHRCLSPLSNRIIPHLNKFLLVDPMISPDNEMFMDNKYVTSLLFTGVLVSGNASHNIEYKNSF